MNPYDYLLEASDEYLAELYDESLIMSMTDTGPLDPEEEHYMVLHEMNRRGLINPTLH